MIRRLNALAVAGILALTMARPALAQPQSGSPALPSNAQEAAQQFNARYSPYMQAAYQKGNRAITAMEQWFEARRARDPSQPTLRQSFEAYVRAHPEELDQRVVSAVHSDAAAMVENAESITGLIENGQGMRDVTAAQREQAVGSVGNLGFNGEAAMTQAYTALFSWTMGIFANLAIQEEANGLPHQIFLDLDGAGELLSYAANTRVTHVRQEQAVFNETLHPTMQSLENANAFNRNYGVEDFEYSEGGYLISVGADGSVWFGDAPNHVFTQVVSRDGNTISAATRQRIEQFIRTHFPNNPGILAAAIAQIEAVNRIARGSSSLIGGEYQDTATLQLINEILVNGQLPRLVWRPSAFGSFLYDGGALSVAQIAAIYTGYDPFNGATAATSHAGQSLSATATTSAFNPTGAPSLAPNSLSALGASLSAAGSLSPSSSGSITPDYRWGGGASAIWNQMAVNWGDGSAIWSTPSMDWGGGMSSAGSPGPSLAGGPWALPLGSDTTVNRHSASNGFYTDLGYQRIADPTGRLGQRSVDGQLAGFVGEVTVAELLRVLRTSGVSGLNALLAQPFNVILTWGGGANDVDLHMTGPLDGGGRFHIYYAAPGDLNGPPHAALIHDCICTNGSEVILLSQLNQGGVYRISAFDFGNQSPGSTELTSSAANLQLQIVRGGVAVSQGAGTTIEGGQIVFTLRPTPGQAGNTWVGVEIDPQNGAILGIDRTVVSTGGGADVN